MLELKNTDSFLKDLRYFQKELSKISREPARQHAQQLFTEFKKHCNIIDEAHSSRNNGSVDPRAARENIEKLVEIRRQLHKYVEDSK